MAKSGRPLMPSAINNILYNIVDAYNHVSEMSRIESEITRLDSVAIS